MALINCPDCGKEISSTARMCLYCGYRKKRNKKYLELYLITFFMVLLFGVSVVSRYKHMQYEKQINALEENADTFEKMSESSLKSSKETSGLDSDLLQRSASTYSMYALLKTDESIKLSTEEKRFDRLLLASVILLLITIVLFIMFFKRLLVQRKSSVDNSN